MLAADVTAPTSGRLFYLALAIAAGLAALAGFVPPYFERIAHGHVPVLVHVHTVVFSAWLSLFLVQTWLAKRGSLSLHRALGWSGAWLAGMVVFFGLFTTVMSIRLGTAPRFFPPNVLLAVNGQAALVFGTFTIFAIRMRNRPEWHKRLMVIALVVLLAPAFSRILPMAALGPSGPLAVLACQLAFIAAGVVYDIITLRRVHPAYWWGVAAIVIVPIIAVPLSFSSPGRALIHAIQR